MKLENTLSCIAA